MSRLQYPESGAPMGSMADVLVLARKVNVATEMLNAGLGHHDRRTHLTHCDPASPNTYTVRPAEYATKLMLSGLFFQNDLAGEVDLETYTDVTREDPFVATCCELGTNPRVLGGAAVLRYEKDRTPVNPYDPDPTYNGGYHVERVELNLDPYSLRQVEVVEVDPHDRIVSHMAAGLVVAESVGLQLVELGI